jgi:hypothetical protein
MKMMRSTMRIAGGSVVLALIFLAALPAHAQVYKTIDANGKVVYTDTPPVGAKKTEVVPGATSVKPSTDRTDWQEKDREFRSRKAKSDEAGRKEEEENKLASKERNVACLQARDQVESLNRAVPLYRVNEKGERVYLDDAERAATLKSARQAVADNCPR